MTIRIKYFYTVDTYEVITDKFFKKKNIWKGCIDIFDLATATVYHMLNCIGNGKKKSKNYIVNV